MSRDRPWYKRYPSNFLNGVHGMGEGPIAAYSIILDVIYDRGGSCPDDAKWLSSLIGCSGQRARALISELLKHPNKLYRDAEGRLRNPKADFVLGLTAGGTAPPTAPLKTGPISPPDKGRHDPRDNPRAVEAISAENNGLRPPSRARAHAGVQRLEEREQKKEERNEVSAPDGAGADAPPVSQSDAPELPGIPKAPNDQLEIPAFLRREAAASTAPKAPPKPSNPDKAWLFADGLEYLSTATGRAIAAQRPLVGKWLVQLSDNAGMLREIFEACQRAEPGDVVPWITAAVAQRKSGTGSAPPPPQPNRFEPPSHSASLEGHWRLCVQGFLNTGLWSEQNGPSPLEKGCRVPNRILTEFAPKLAAKAAKIAAAQRK